jgi:acetyl/propionyl-CoA carboxylase alpha subunit/cytidylate kinase
MGIETVVVYSQADKDAPYIAKATESYDLGPGVPAQNYLNVNVLNKVIKQSGVDAVHPGYGFLAESVLFSAALMEAGVQWIGPAPRLLMRIESRCYCRGIASTLGIPVIPGTDRVINHIDAIYKTAARVGLPILLKLDHGGAGKGIQKIDHFESKAVTQAIFDSLRWIGTLAFTNGDVYIEKDISGPRHIEVQFMADHQGSVVYLGERDCSIQRRYQKIIEESPSVVVTEADRQQLYAYTKKFIKALNYSGVGTIEYLRSAEGIYYFLGINARLQAEHPVSELVTGLDLVEWQIRIANGETVPLTQPSVKGHAIECRIYAEDPKTFMPAPGIITKLSFPDTENAAIRIEHAIGEGYQLSPFYDSMLCKISLWGEDRNTAIAAMKNTLSSVVIEGVTTNITTNIAILRNKDFVAGTFGTNFLDREEAHTGLENYSVTISRQFGSLGHYIAKKMAELLGIPFYDRNIVEQVAKELHLPVPAFEGEDIDSGYGKMSFPLGTGSDAEKERIFEAQKKIILGFAEKNSGIYVGRCAAYILRNHTNHFSIFIYAPKEVRRANCINIMHIDPGKVDEIINKVDEARQSYLMHYANVYSEDVAYKDILIDSSTFSSVEEAAGVLVSMIREKFNLA